MKSCTTMNFMKGQKASVCPYMHMQGCEKHLNGQKKVMHTENVPVRDPFILNLLVSFIYKDILPASLSPLALNICN